MFSLARWAAGQNVSLPRGLYLDLSVAESSHAAQLADQIERKFNQGYYGRSEIIAHDITNCDQQCSNWCWATSAAMSASAFGGSSDCNGQEAKAAGHEFGTTCDSSCSASCNHGGTMTQTCDAIEFLSGQKYKFTPYALQPEDLENALQIGPVVVGVQWSLGGGHAITINGVSQGTYIGHDPEGYPISVDYIGLLRYSPVYCQYPCSGTWMASSSPVGAPVAFV